MGFIVIIVLLLIVFHLFKQNFKESTSEYKTFDKQKNVLKNFDNGLDQSELEKLYNEMGGFLDYSSVVLNIDYVDRKGEQTNRDIAVNSVRESMYDDGFYINAHCLLRDEDRSFTIKNIANAYVNGEKVDLIRYLVDLYKSSSTYKIIKLLNKKMHVLNILNYIAIIDGRFQKNEKEIIASFFKDEDNTLNFDILLSKISEIRPDARIFRKTLKEIQNIDQEELLKIKNTALLLCGKDEMKLSAAKMIPA